MVTLFPYGSIKLKNTEGLKFKVNGQRVKHYLGETEDLKFICEVELVKA